MKPMSTRQLLSATLMAVAIVASSLTGCGGRSDEQEDARRESGAPEQRHTQHRSLSNNVAHRGIIVLENSYEPPADVRRDLESVLNAYAELRDALVEADINAANQTAATMAKAVQTVSSDEMEARGREAWDQHENGYKRVLREFRHVGSLEQKRSYFAHLSEIVYCTMKSFGMGEKLSNVFFCPMVFDGKGAYWLSETNKVRNPYFGDQMLRCGERTEVLDGDAPPSDQRSL